MSNIVVCGDSYSVGIGCYNLEKEPYGSLLANHYGKNLINLAKGSSSNLSIFLQVKYVVENLKEVDFVCVSITSYNRTEWFPDGLLPVEHWDLNNRDVNYHQYPPYGKDTYPMILNNPMESDEKYNGKMFTENYLGIVDYVDNVLDKGIDYNYFAKFRNERPEKMRLLRNYFFEIFDESIQRQYDIGVITLAHTLLKNKGIEHYILAWDYEFKKYIPNENFIHVDWGELSLKYPDQLGSFHTSEVGQRIVFEKILEKKNKNVIL